jgi:hypothetical protein
MVTKSDGEWLKGMLKKMDGARHHVELDFQNPIHETPEVLAHPCN